MEDDGNLEVRFSRQCCKLAMLNYIRDDLCLLNNDLQLLLRQSEEDTDYEPCWFEPKANLFKKFSDQVNVWINEARKVNESVHPLDSVPSAGSRKSRNSWTSSACSSTSSAATRLIVKIDRALLTAHAAGLEQKHVLERQEAKIKLESERQEGKIKAENERQEAEIKAENKRQKTKIKANDDTTMQHQGDDFATRSQNNDTTTQRQNDIAEFLLKQLKIFTVPPQSIPVFKGDLLEYKLFTRAYEHGVESTPHGVAHEDQRWSKERAIKGG